MSPCGPICSCPSYKQRNLFSNSSFFSVHLPLWGAGAETEKWWSEKWASLGPDGAPGGSGWDERHKAVKSGRWRDKASERDREAFGMNIVTG